MVTDDTHIQHQRSMKILLDEFDRICNILQIPYVLFAGTLLGAVRHKGFIPWDDDLDVIMLRKDYERFLQGAPQHLDQQRFYLQKEFGEHWPMFFSKLRLNGTTCLETFHPKDTRMHQGIYIDIFPCDDAAKTHLGRYAQFLSSRVVVAKSLYRRGYETNSIIKKTFIALCRLLPLRLFAYLAKSGATEGEWVHSFFAGASTFSKNVYPRSIFTEITFAQFEDRYYPVPVSYDVLLTQLFGQYMVKPPQQQRKIKKHAVLIDTENSYEKYQDFLKDTVFEFHTRSIR